jgi:putative membrane protein
LSALQGPAFATFWLLCETGVTKLRWTRRLMGPQRRVRDEHSDPAQRAGWATYRSWRSTALVLVVVGVLAVMSGRTGGLKVLGVVLTLTGVATLVAGRRRWRAMREAIAAGGPIPATRLPLLVSSVVIMAALALVVLLTGARR